jgi:uncharacterized membrane protein (DUF106 family)
MDEREKKHEAIAERNALFGIITIIVAGILYEAITSTLNQKISINPFLIMALIVGVIIKAISNIYLDKKD